MTKNEVRELMSVELVRCISESLNKLPAHIKIDSKGTKRYISLKDYGIYVCFYVTSSLYYSVWRFGIKEVDEAIFIYNKDRDANEVRAIVRNAFDEIIGDLEKHKAN